MKEKQPSVFSFAILLCLQKIKSAAMREHSTISWQNLQNTEEDLVTKKGFHTLKY